jgi:ankyrin repeat protein
LRARFGPHARLAPQQDGNTPLHIAAEKRSPLAVAALLGAGASHEARNAEGQTPLMRLVTKAPFPPTQVKTEALSLLIASGADVNASDKVRISGKRPSRPSTCRARMRGSPH